MKTYTSICLVAALLSTPLMTAHAEESEAPVYQVQEQPDFSPGSKLLQGLLATSKFNDFFSATIVNGADMSDKLATYNFKISKDGIICPFRIMKDGGNYEFFSNFYENAGCIDLRNFANNKRISSEYQSEKNTNPPAYNDGKKEEDGIRFNMIADSVDQTLTDSGQIATVTFKLKVSGKAHIAHIMWGEGSTTFTVKATKAGNSWSVSSQRDKKSTDWTTFTHLNSHIPHLSGAGKAMKAIGSLFSSSGSQENPIKLKADSTDYQ